MIIFHESAYTRGEDDVETGATMGGGRQSLDRLMARLREPVFLIRHRRVPSATPSSGHVNLDELAMAPPRSRYVRRWRRHARRCRTCAEAFRYLGLSLK